VSNRSRKIDLLLIPLTAGPTIAQTNRYDSFTRKFAAAADRAQVIPPHATAFMAHLSADLKMVTKLTRLP
jgi:hypothetical protein